MYLIYICCSKKSLPVLWYAIYHDRAANRFQINSICSSIATDIKMYIKCTMKKHLDPWVSQQSVRDIF